MSSHIVEIITELDSLPKEEVNSTEKGLNLLKELKEFSLTNLLHLTSYITVSKDYYGVSSKCTDEDILNALHIVSHVIGSKTYEQLTDKTSNETDKRKIKALYNNAIKSHVDFSRELKKLIKKFIGVDIADLARKIYPNKEDSILG